MRNTKIVTTELGVDKEKKMHMDHDFQMECPSKSSSEEDQVYKRNESSTASCSLSMQLEDLFEDGDNDINNIRRKKKPISPNLSLNQTKDLSSKSEDNSFPHSNKKKRRRSFECTDSLSIVRDTRIRSKTFSYNRSPSFSDISLCHNEIDAQLAEELKGYNTPLDYTVEATPIPLLTPPASPVPIKSEESDVVIYEWPSNLVVDNALIAASKLHPLSLSEMEEIDECREPINISIF